jgi:hypothetical protein
MKIVWAHPTTGKTTAKKKGKYIIDFDSDYKPVLREYIELQHNTTAKELKETNREEYDRILLHFWDEAVAKSKYWKQPLFVSDMIILRERRYHLDLVITMDKETFMKRAVERGDDENMCITWKKNIDKAVKDVSLFVPVISTDNYIVTLLTLLVEQ